MITLRPFSPEDASETAIIREILEDGDPIIGITMLQDGKVAAYGGVRSVLGRHWAFFSILDETVRQPFLIHRLVSTSIRAIIAANVLPVHTFADLGKPRAEAWLIRLGFRPLKDSERDEIIKATEEATGCTAWILGGTIG